ncbi:unnamed protein product [Linum trigynum]|uniref:Uncharacterized protein n=1 Tax=Linum trigynum TaxID=586398 RepID=A0AAV2FMX0_9ROSI
MLNFLNHICTCSTLVLGPLGIRTEANNMSQLPTIEAIFGRLRGQLLHVPGLSFPVWLEVPPGCLVNLRWVPTWKALPNSLRHYDSKQETSFFFWLLVRLLKLSMPFLFLPFLFSTTFTMELDGDSKFISLSPIRVSSSILKCF